MNRRILVSASLILALVLGNDVLANTAYAGIQALVTNSGFTSITSGKWGVVAASNPTNSTTGSYTIRSIKRSTIPVSDYFTVRNIGTIQASSMSLDVRTSGSGNYVTNIHECLGGIWNETTGACSGNIALVRTNTNAQTTSSTWIKSLNPGDTIRLRIQYVASNPAQVDANISIAVARSNLRPALSTNG